MVMVKGLIWETHIEVCGTRTTRIAPTQVWFR